MFDGKDTKVFSEIISAVITVEDFQIENPSEPIKIYLKQLEKIGTLEIRESDYGYVDVLINRELKPLFRSKRHA